MVFTNALLVIKVLSLDKWFGKHAIECTFHRLDCKGFRFNKECFLLFFICKYLNCTKRTCLAIPDNGKKSLCNIALQ